jgi:flavin-dependent dehydrogenase
MDATLRILVVGGGPAGCASALELARLGHEVFLLERAARLRPRLGEICDARGCRELESLCGLQFPTGAHRPLATMVAAWGAGEAFQRSLPFWQAGHGFALDRKALNQWLLDSAAAAGVRVICGCRILSCRPNGSRWGLVVSVGGREQRLEVGFIVEATGRASRSVIQPDARRLFVDNLVCLSVEVPGLPSVDSEASVEPCRVGWWFTTHPPGPSRVVSLFTDADLVPPEEGRLDWLCSLLEDTAHTRQLAGSVPERARMYARDARTSARGVLWRGTWMPVGDAATCFDPLSGSGIRQAVADGVGAARAISDALTTRDPERLRSHALARVESFRAHLSAQHEYYRSERRWEGSSFWQRRH